MHRFYYDETEHSRSITKGTVEAENFFDGFVTVTVGLEDRVAKSGVSKF